MSYGDIAPFYRRLAIGDRIYARLRYATAPLERVAALVPASTRSLVEIGCSAGVFANVLKTRRPDVAVTGVDADERKIAAARGTAAGRPGLVFELGDGKDWLERAGELDAAAFVDVLYLFPAAAQDEFIGAAAARLRPGGCLLVKEMNDRPAWKRRWCEFQEWVAVRLTGFTRGRGVYLRPGSEYRQTMRAAGLEVEGFDLSRGYPHPHYAWRGIKR